MVGVEDAGRRAGGEKTESIERVSGEERMKRLLTVNFNITKCPERIYQDFVKFCCDETNNNYAFGLKALLEARKANIKEVMLYEKVAALRDDVEALKISVAKLDGTGKKEGAESRQKLKTMGSKTKDKEGDKE